MMRALDHHLTDHRATADHLRQVCNQLAHLGATLQRLGAQGVDLDPHLLDAAAQFGVLGTKVVELP